MPLFLGCFMIADRRSAPLPIPLQNGYHWRLPASRKQFDLFSSNALGCDGVVAGVGNFLRVGLGVGQLSAPLRPCGNPYVPGALAGKQLAHFDASGVIYYPGAVLGPGLRLAAVHGTTSHGWNRIHVG